MKRTRVTSLVAVVLSATLLLFVQTAPAVQPPGGGAQPDATAADSLDVAKARSTIVELTNEFRAEQGLPSLETDESLQQAAQKFAEFMAAEDVYGHHADGQTPAQRAKAAGYEYCIVRENIAYRTDTRDNEAVPLATKFVEGWKDSPEHRENMLAQHLQDIGVGLATTDGTTFFAVQKFGRPRSASITVQVVNESQQAAELEIESDSGSDSMEIPPRAIARFQRCLPTQFSLAASEQSLKITEDAKLQIVATDEGVALRRSDSETTSP